MCKNWTISAEQHMSWFNVEETLLLFFNITFI